MVLSNRDNYQQDFVNCDYRIGRSCFLGGDCIKQSDLNGTCYKILQINSKIAYAETLANMSETDLKRIIQQ